MWSSLFSEDIYPIIPQEFLAVSKLLYLIPKPGHTLSTRNVSSADDDYLSDTVAIIGLSCKFPGANNPEEFWKLLYDGKDAMTEVPSERWDTSRETKKTLGGFIDASVDEFDANFFNISPREATVMDPQQRFLLESTWEALENAGINPQELKGSTTGVFMGFWNQDYQTILKIGQGTNDFIRSYLGNAISASSARLSFFLGSHGPNIASESGCSSALLSLHLACESLKKRDCNLAIAGGVNLILVPYSANLAASAHVLASDGHCKTFDEKADGFGRGEGVGVIVLKRFSDAVRDGDNIMAVVRGSAFNQEGTTSSFGTPSKFCQQKVMEMALRNSNLAPSDVTYVEAHGTGTFVGDPIEVAAIGSVYGKDRNNLLHIGSVKTNIGHSESAAGIAGLLKIVLSLQKQIIPPNINFHTLNPYINLDEIPARIPLEPTEWAANKNGKRLGALNSFGMSGTNVHVILEESPKIKRFIHANEHITPPQYLLNITAKSENALHSALTNYINYLKNNTGVNLHDMCYTANVVRARFNHRISMVAQDQSQMQHGLEKQLFNMGKVQGVLPKIAFIFTGQGSQFKGMCKQLYQNLPPFRIALDKCSKILEKYYDANLFDILWNDKSVLLDDTLHSQTSIFCIEYSLMQVWKSFGVSPDIVFGHSVGEFAAAVAAEVLSFEDALKLVYERSKIIQELPEGGMMAVKTTLEKTISLIDSLVSSNANLWLDVAVVNSTDEIVISGRPQSLDEFSNLCDQLNPPIRHHRLAATHAFHSRDMETILPAYGEVISSVRNNTPKCCYVSCASGKVLENSEFNQIYWQKHARDPVNFAKGMDTLYKEGARFFIEVGPQPILLALGMSNLVGEKATECSWLPTIRKNEKEWVTILNSISKLFVNGFDINWNEYYLNFPATKVQLPNYPFQRQKYWVHTSDIFNLNILHPLLGKNLNVVSKDYFYEHKIRLDHLPYLNDHKVADKFILPGAGFLEMVLASGHVATSGYSHFVKPMHTLIVSDFSIEAALEIDPDFPCQMQVVVGKLPLAEGKEEAPAAFELSESQSSEMEITIYGKDTDADANSIWRRHAKARFTAFTSMSPSETFDIETIKKRCNVEKPTAEFYKRTNDAGVQLGPSFQSLKSFWTDSDEVIAEISCEEETENYICHPIILDAMIQVGGLQGVKDVKNSTGMVVPIGVEQFIIYPHEKAKTLYAYVKSTEAKVVDIVLLNEQGHQLASMRGVRLIPTSVQAFLNALTYHKREVTGLYEEVHRHKMGPLMCRVELADVVNNNEWQDKLTHCILDTEKTFDEHVEATKRIENGIVTTIVHSFCKIGWKPQLNEMIILRDFITKHDIDIRQECYINRLLDILAGGNILEIQRTNKSKTWKVVNLPTHYEEEDLEKKFLKYHCTAEELHSSTAVQLIIQVGQRLADILLGKCNPLSVLFPKEGEGLNVANFYTNAPHYVKMNNDSAEILDCLFSSLTTKARGQVLRILEVGSGTGATTRALITRLQENKIPFMYTFTDVSPQFISDAKDAFNDVSNLEYELFNVEKDPKTQNIAPYHYDVVVAVNVLHATERISESVSNMRHLLIPGGVVLIGEIFAPVSQIDMIFGILEGFWKFRDYDLRPEHPMISVDKWEKVLKANGFLQTICKTSCCELGGIIVGKATDTFYLPLPSPHIKETTKNIWLIFSDGSNLTNLVIKHFQSMRKTVVVVKKSEEFHFSESKFDFGVHGPNPEHFTKMFNILKEESGFIEGVVYLWALSEERQEYIAGAFNHISQFLASKNTKTRLCVVTKGNRAIDDQIVASVECSTLRGIFLSLLIEQINVSGLLFDMDSEQTDDENTVREIFHEIWSSRTEFQVIYRSGKKILTRINKHPPLPLPLVIPKSEQYTLQIPQSKSIHDVVLVPKPKCVTLGDNQMEVEIRATGLNFKDVFMILKPEGFHFDKDIVGVEFAGIVTRVDQGITKYSIGDEIFGVSLYTSVASHVVVNENVVMRKPASITFAQAATMPVVFFTAYYCLVEVANIKAGETVLVHVASGGVGLAAIQICKYLGAKIIGTAGSQRKRKYLSDLGVEHVFHSRNTSFGDDIMRVTNGVGVDMVLNSLTGTNMKETSLRVCKPNANFVEMSNIQIWKPEEVKELRPDVVYTIVNLETGLHEHVSVVSKLEKHILSENFKPLPCTQFDVTQSIEALLHFQKALQIGKIVITMPKISYLNSVLEIQERMFHEESTYIITGGLGGIGMEVTKWMSSVGAKHIVLIGRQKPTPETQNMIDELNTQRNVNIKSFQVDVGNSEQLACLLNTIGLKDSGFPPLRGIMHSAGTLSDGILINQTWDKYQTVFRAKVQGTWNLHNLTKNYDLEFFVLFSSVAALFGPLSQPNHSAANCFLDAFAHYRHSIGLPAVSVNWGIWGEVGAAYNIGLGKEGAFGVKPFSPKLGIGSLRAVMRHHIRQVAAIEIHDASAFVQSFKHLYPYVQELLEGYESDNLALSSAESDKFWKDIQHTEHEKRFEVVQKLLEKSMRLTLKLAAEEPLDEHQNFKDMGMDSLMAVEMRNRLQHVFGKYLTLNATSLMDYPTLSGLSHHLAELTYPIVFEADGSAKISADCETEKKLESNALFRALVKEDCILPDDIKDIGGVVEVSAINKVFITGGTGTLGVYIINLLSKIPGMQIVSLIRAKSDKQSKSRLIEKLRKYNLYDTTLMTNIECQSGDITRPYFGLDIDKYNSLTQTVDAVFHLAVKANHYENYKKSSNLNDIRSVNVLGTINVLKFASTVKTKRICYTSTFVAATELTEDEYLVEDFPAEDNFGEEITGGYAMSKFVCEKLFHSAVDRGLPCVVLRLPDLVGNSITGLFAIEKSHMMALIIACIQLGVMPNEGGIYFSLPVDIAAWASLELFLNHKVNSGLFNLVKPEGMTSIDSLNLAEEYNRKMKKVTLSEFTNCLNSSNNPILAPFLEFYESEKSVWKYFRSSPALNLISKSSIKNTIYRSCDKVMEFVPDFENIVPHPKEVFRQHYEFFKKEGMAESLEFK